LIENTSKKGDGKTPKKKQKTRKGRNEKKIQGIISLWMSHEKYYKSKSPEFGPTRGSKEKGKWSFVTGEAFKP